MSSFGTGQTLSRIEDLRLLTGQGRYVDDIAPRDALHAVFLRAPVAHAEIAELDVTDARQMPGVHLILTLSDLRAAGLRVDMEGKVLRNADGSDAAAPERPLLADGRVRFVGEAVAVVVAETPDEARDAAEAIMLDYNDLPVKVDLAPGGATVHAEAPDNIAYDWHLGDAGATEAAFRDAAHVVRLRAEDNRIIVNSMEPRGAYAEWVDDRLHVCASGQGVWDLKDELIRAFNLPEDRIRVTNPDVGGGFGMKGMTYPEYFVIAEAARQLGRPVRWMSERTEAMLTDNAGRDLVTETELAFDAELKITAYRVNILSNLGAYNSGFGQAIQSQLFAKVLTGAYDIKTVHMQARGVYTNTTQVDAYRGAGRPEAIFALERTMDQAARELGVDPVDLRLRNFIRSFPYRTASGENYDVGDFPRVLGRARDEADMAGFAKRRAASAEKGRLRGIGLAYYIESILGAPEEGAAVEFHDDGTVSMYVGTQSNGQGHETVFAAFLSARTGIPIDAIRVVQGDSDRIRQGGGTGGSRSVTVQSTATIAMIDKMVTNFTPFLADELGVPEGAIAFDDGAFRAEGSNRTLTLVEAAEAARAAGRTDLLRHETRARLPGRSYPNGAHICEVEVDPETGQVRLDRYTVVDDFGVLMHPRLAEGQVHGGVAQGMGQAMLERVVHDDTGQLLTATFMDYAMPRADDLPMFRFVHEGVPSTANPIGMKGCGEAGTVGALAAISNAVQDALWERGVTHVDMPFTPQRVWGWLQESGGNAAS